MNNGLFGQQIALGGPAQERNPGFAQDRYNGQAAQMPQEGISSQSPYGGQPAQMPQGGQPAEMPEEGNPALMPNETQEYSYLGNPSIDKYIHMFIG